MEKIIMKWTEGRSKGSPIPTMVIQTILAMFSRSFSIVVHEVCLLFSAIFNPNLWKTHVHLHGRSAAALRKIHVVPHNYLQVSAQNNHRIPQKSWVFHVMYRTSVRKIDLKERKMTKGASRCLPERNAREVSSSRTCLERSQLHQMGRGHSGGQGKMPWRTATQESPPHLHVPCWGMPQLGHWAWDPRMMDGCPEEAGN